MKRKLIFLIIILAYSCSSPNELIESADCQPQCIVTGSGDYTIVIDAGMGNWALFFDPLIKELKGHYKICRINRSGYGMDTVPTIERNLTTVSEEINEALEQHGVTDNIVLIGHSLGGLHVRMFQYLFPEKVVGMVLLDASHPKQFELLPNEFDSLKNVQFSNLEEVKELALKGYLSYSKKSIPTFGLPEDLLDQYYEVTTKPAYYHTMQMEVKAFDDNLKEIDQLPDLGNLPLLVIGSGNSMNESILPGEIEQYPFAEHNKIWFDLQKDLALLSTNSNFHKSEGSHYLHLDDTKIVSHAIDQFIQINFLQ